MRVIILAAALSVFAVLAGCVPEPDAFTPVSPGARPTDYKAIIAPYIKYDFFDPHSLRDVSISEPFEGKTTVTQGVFRIPISEKHGWFVCVEMNAKNRSGAYTGLKRWAFFIRDGSIIDQIEEAPVCASEPLTPWPEMEMK